MFVFVIEWAVQVGAGVQVNGWMFGSQHWLWTPEILWLLRLIFALGPRITKCSLKSDLAVIEKFECFCGHDTEAMAMKEPELSLMCM